MKWQIFVLAVEIPCEWMLATKFASDCECDGVVHSGIGAGKKRGDQRRGQTGKKRTREDRSMLWIC